MSEPRPQTPLPKSSLHRDISGDPSASVLPHPLGLQQPLSAQQLSALTPTALAYIGDAVYELYIRTRMLWPPQHIRQYHQAVVAQVKAEQQAQALQELLPYLNEAEHDIVRRGRNATQRRQRRVSADLYQRATGFEALLGYLYLTDLERMGRLLNYLEQS
ncbi:MAG: ribonuclease III domain-containing protein [Cyanobacteria bacterium J06648_16]